MVVHLAGHEVAHHEVVALEDLVRRRRLVHAAGDRLEVVDAERVRVQAAVPADHVEGMGRVHHARADDRSARAVLDEHLDVGALAQQRLGGPVQVTLAVGRVLEQLAVARQVALGRRDVAVGLDGVGAQRPLPVRKPAVRGRGRDDDVVALPGLQGSEHGLHGGLAGLDVDDLVADGVAVQRRVLGGHDVGDADVAVAEHEPAPGDHVGLGPGLFGEQLVQPEMPGLERVVGGGGLVGQLPHLRVDDRRGQPAVVQQGRVGGEALLAHQLLVVEPAFVVAMLRVALRGHGADLAVVRHDCLLAVWSRAAGRPASYS